MRYSPSTNGFYPEDNEYPNIPEDVIEISNELYIELLNGQVGGKIITPNGSDAPYLSDPAPPTNDQIVALAESMRATLLSAADAIMLDWRTELALGEISDEDRRKLSLWLDYKKQVKAVDVSTAFTWPTPPER